MLVFPCRNGVGDILVYFMSLLDYLLPCLYRASTVPSRVLATGFSLEKKEGNGQRPAVLMLLIAFTECDVFLFGWCLHFEVFLILFSIYLSCRGAHILLDF